MANNLTRSPFPNRRILPTQSSSALYERHASLFFPLSRLFAFSDSVLVSPSSVGAFFFFWLFSLTCKTEVFFFFSPGALDEATREHIRRLKLHLFSIEKKNERERESAPEELSTQALIHRGKKEKHRDPKIK